MAKPQVPVQQPLGSFQRSQAPSPSPSPSPPPEGGSNKRLKILLILGVAAAIFGARFAMDPGQRSPRSQPREALPMVNDTSQAEHAGALVAAGSIEQKAEEQARLERERQRSAAPAAAIDAAPAASEPAPSQKIELKATDADHIASESARIGLASKMVPFNLKGFPAPVLQELLRGGRELYALDFQLQAGAGPGYLVDLLLDGALVTEFTSSIPPKRIELPLKAGETSLLKFHIVEATGDAPVVIQLKPIRAETWLNTQPLGKGASEVWSLEAKK